MPLIMAQDEAGLEELESMCGAPRADMKDVRALVREDCEG